MLTMSHADFYEKLEDYRQYLLEQRLSFHTIQKYVGDMKALFPKGEEPVAISQIQLDILFSQLEKELKISTINSYKKSCNRFFQWAKFDIKLALTTTQSKNSLENVLSLEDYDTLTCVAMQKNKYKAFAIMSLLANTGIRVGEIKFLTREALYTKGFWVYDKAKYRYVCLSNSLCELLEIYCKYENITQGPIFLGKNNSPISEKGVWIMLKRLARTANVDEDLVYPHSFRHLFAKLYIDKTGNIADLADILGHNSIETTRIYTRTSIDEKREILDSLIP
jgi:site-specific recombinase XerD